MMKHNRVVALRSWTDVCAVSTVHSKPNGMDKMSPPVAIFYLLLIMKDGLVIGSKVRRTVFFQDMNLKQFRESASLSSLTIRDDVGQLVVGARGKVFTLSLEDITKKTSEVKWTVSSREKVLCQMKGKDSKECDNFIRTVHTMEDGKMLICGTNAFNPVCDFMNFKNGKVSLDGNKHSARGKVPFDPYQRFASFMDGNTLYSASSSNFLGTEVFFQRHGLNPLKTEMKRSWLNEPSMISIDLVKVSKHNVDGEDDQVFLFFTENAVEERLNIKVSRIARVCKSDLGGKRTLQKKWTTFLKARLDCPFGDVGSPTLVQDVFLVEHQTHWRDSVFYAAFTSNSEPLGGCSKSAVCAYKLSDISQVFSGKFLTERDTGSWNTYTEEQPFPHPGSCINDGIRAKGVMTSLDLSDKTLLFVRNHPLMDGAVTPITGRPLLVQTEIRFSKIVVDQVTSLDGRQHQVMFIGTDSGWLQKAVRFDGEDSRIIEELQLFQTPQPVNFLQLSLKTGQLYSGSHNVAVQVNVRECSRYTSCDDCLFARDPYCGWHQIRSQCMSIAGTSARSMIQNLTDGDIRMCPTSDLKPTIVHLATGRAQFLPCSPETNLPVSWRFSSSVLYPGPQHTLISQGLVIRPSYSDAGLYTCETVETVKGKEHHKTVVQYFVQIQDTNNIIRNLKVTVITLAGFATVLILVICRLFLIRQMAKKQNHIGCANENTNNSQGIPVKPFCHSDKTKYRRMPKGHIWQRSAPSHTQVNRKSDAESVISILILPEVTVAKVAEEGMAENDGDDCVVIAIEE
ncbi:semaphorin-4E-like [Anabas testudineus]|uniref:semaphorin-4E-like n=1 Tax=Anabas testudineus TaxID=64144 RepID=UPI000E4633E1|nr:semaphorin-4E-like [Anabas testudineus]